MTNHRTSHRSQHPARDVALLETDDPKVRAVGTPGARPEQTIPSGPPPSVRRLAPEHDAPALQTDEPIASQAPHVSLLAATALGFAFSSGATERNVRTLTILAGPHTDILLEAGTAVLELEIAPRETRAIAAELLGRAALRCA